MAELNVTLRAVPDVASAQAAGQQMANAANVGALGTPFNVRQRAAAGGIPPLAIPPEMRRAQQQAQRVQAQQMRMFTGLSFLAAPTANPTSLWGNLLAGVAINRSGLGARIGGAMGMGGAAGAAAGTVALVGAAAAVGAAFKLLTESVKRTADAFDRASKLYAYKGMSGYSDQFSSQRFTASKILGISTEDVIRFGGALNYLNPQLKIANDNFARTYRTLTLTNWKFKEAGVNMESLFATIANSAAPALNAFATGISRIVTAVDTFAQAHPAFAKILAAMALSPVGGQSLPFLGGAGGQAPIGPMGQTPKKSSPWERMGLVIGGPDYQQQALAIWRDQLRALMVIAGAVKGSQVPRGSQPLNSHYLTPFLPENQPQQ